jgi:hypothetical protein
MHGGEVRRVGNENPRMIKMMARESKGFAIVKRRGRWSVEKFRFLSDFYGFLSLSSCLEASLPINNGCDIQMK